MLLKIFCQARVLYAVTLLLGLIGSVLRGTEGSVMKNLTVCFVWEKDSYFAEYRKVLPLVDLGVQHANAFVLPNVASLSSVFLDLGDTCSRVQYQAVYALYDYLNTSQTCHLILGASCPITASILYGFAKGLNIPLLGCPAAGASSLQTNSSIDDYPLFVQPTLAMSDVSRFVLGFLDHSGYVHVSVIRDDSYTFYVNLADSVVRAARTGYPTLFSNTTVSVIRSLQTTMEEYRKILVEANEHSRVILLFAHARAVRRLLVLGAELGYTKGQHIFIAIELFTLEQYWGRITPILGDAYDSVAVEAFRSLIVVSLLNEQSDELKDAFDKSIKRIAEDRYNYTFGIFEEIDIILTSHYESIMVFATILKRLAQLGRNYLDGKLITQQMANSEFDNPLGGKVYFGKNRNREKGYAIKHYDPDIEKFQMIIQYRAHAQLNLSYRPIKSWKWPGEGHLPPDEPTCGFRNDKCIADGLSPTLIGLVVGIPLLCVCGLVVAAGVFYQSIRKQLDINPDWWKIPASEIQLLSGLNKSGLSRRTLKSQTTLRTTHSQYILGLFAIYNGVTVGLVDVAQGKRTAHRELAQQAKTLKSMDQPNLQHFIGIAMNTSGLCVYIVGEACSKGSLTDVLENQVINLDWLFKNLIIRDIISGMVYLHNSPISSHGNLTSDICFLDSRFTLKIGDYGLPYFRDLADLQPPRMSDDERNYSLLLWRAPEFLRQIMPPKGTQKGDIYSFGIILQQIILRCGPFELPTDSAMDAIPKDIVFDVAKSEVPPIRPRVPHSACSNELYDLMEKCWDEYPVQRPAFSKIRERFQKISGNLGDGIIDSLFKRMEAYASDLEQKVAEQTQEFMEEKMRSEQLLGELLPKQVAEALTKGLSVDPEAFECVTIFFSDVVGFTTISSKGTPLDVIDLLNNLYTFFDEVLGKYDVYKVETIGDAYLVASGLPVRNGNKHVREISSMALDLIKGIARFEVPRQPAVHVEIRVGINSGPCVTGIVGKKMPRYCLFGDTVNVASRMESTGEPMKIHISKEAKGLLDSIGGFVTSERGEIAVKGKGLMTTYWLHGRSPVFN